MKLNPTQTLIAILFPLFALVNAPSAAEGANAVQTYVQPLCKFSFHCPVGARKVLPDSDEETDGTRRDCVSLRWKGGALGVRLMKMSLESAIAETHALQKDESGKWYRPGRFDAKGAATSVQFGPLKGLYATSMCGISDSNGFHAATGSCLSGFLTDGHQTAYFETDGIFPTDTVVQVVMPSFKFPK